MRSLVWDCVRVLLHAAGVVAYSMIADAYAAARTLPVWRAAVVLVAVVLVLMSAVALADAVGDVWRYVA